MPGVIRRDAPRRDAQPLWQSCSLLSSECASFLLSAAYGDADTPTRSLTALSCRVALPCPLAMRAHGARS